MHATKWFRILRFGFEPTALLAKGRLGISPTEHNSTGLARVGVSLHHRTIKMQQGGIPSFGGQCSLVNVHVVPRGVGVIPCFVGFSRLEGQDKLPRIGEAQMSLFRKEESYKTHTERYARVRNIQSHFNDCVDKRTLVGRCNRYGPPRNLQFSQSHCFAGCR